MEFASLTRLKPHDKVGIVSPSSVLPEIFPLEYELGLSRLREHFRLEPVELPHTKSKEVSNTDRAADLVQAFTDSNLKAVFTTTGGDVQVEYVKDLPTECFVENKKLFFGYSDNTHFSHHLFMNRIPSYYGGSIYTEFGMQGHMDTLTEKYLIHAIFHGGPIELEPSSEFNDLVLPWGVPENITRRRYYQANEGWYWSGNDSGSGYSWGGCLESVDELLRHKIPLPSLKDFSEVILFLETCEEAPSAEYVARVLRALGELGILGAVRGCLMGRPNARPLFGRSMTDQETAKYRELQRNAVEGVFRRYNSSAPLVQNLDFGHTAPTLNLPYGGLIEIQSEVRRIIAHY